MFSIKDYSKMPLSELVAEEQKIKSQKNIVALLIGLIVGFAVWSATHKGGFFTFVLLFFALRLAGRNAKITKNIRAEIERRG